jgi:hypothetical protein
MTSMSFTTRAGAEGEEPPWFIQLLVRNLKPRWPGSMCVGRIVDGADRARAAARRAARRRCASGWPVFGIATSRTRTGGRTTSPRWRQDLREISATRRRVVPRLGDAVGQAFPFTSPQIEREVGGLIKEAKGVARRSGASSAAGCTSR